MKVAKQAHTEMMNPENVKNATINVPPVTKVMILAANHAKKELSYQTLNVSPNVKMVNSETKATINVKAAKPHAKLAPMEPKKDAKAVEVNYSYPKLNVSVNAQKDTMKTLKPTNVILATNFVLLAQQELKMTVTPV